MREAHLAQLKREEELAKDPKYQNQKRINETMEKLARAEKKLAELTN